MLPDLWNGDAFKSMHDEHAPDQVPGSWCEVVGERVHALLDLLEEIWNVLIIERQRATEEGIQDHTTRPHIHLWPRIQLPCSQQVL